MKGVGKRYIPGVTLMSMSRHERKGAMMQAAFRARMEAQCEQIEQFRLAVMQDGGGRLSQDEAALKWIESYAEIFSQGRDAEG